MGCITSPEAHHMLTERSPHQKVTRLWAERHAHRQLFLAEVEDGRIWVLLDDVRRWAPWLPTDTQLAQKYPRSVARCDDTRRAYMEAQVLCQRLSGYTGARDVPLLKLLHWLETTVLSPARRRAELARQDPRYRVQMVLPTSVQAVAEPPAHLLNDIGQLANPHRWDPRLWRMALGAFGLRRSFLIGIGFAFLTLLASVTLDDMVWDVERRFLFWSWVLVIVLLWSLTMNMAWIVGAVRSGVRRTLEGLNPSLAFTGTMVNVLAASTMFSLVSSNASMAVTNVLYYHFQNEPPVKVVLVPSNRANRQPPMLSVNGPVGIGSLRALRDALDAHPDVRLLMLESPGGLIVEGMAMAELVKRRKLQTLVLGGCASACTLVFVAGEQRWVAKYGEVGFHRSHLPGTAYSLVPNETDHRLGRWYAEQGVSKRFIDRALDTPADGIWLPEVDYMVAEGVATAVWP